MELLRIMKGHIKEVFAYKDMIHSLTKRELRGKYAKSVLGFLWSFLNPLFQILVYTFVFSVIFKNSMDHYYIYLMTGLLPWTFFADSFSQGAVAIISNSEMVKKIYFPRDVLVIAEVNAKLINLLLSMIVMALFIVFSGVEFTWHIVFLPVILFIEYIFALGCALLVSSITVYLRDMEYIVNVILMAWIWGTPVMYNLDAISGVYRRLLTLNPMTPIIVSYQDILYWHRVPYSVNLMVPLVEAVIVLILGEVVFCRLVRGFAEEM